MCYIYLRLLFGIACLAYHTAIKFALYQLLYPEFIVNSFDIKRAAATFVQFVAHSMANINSNGGGVFIFARDDISMSEMTVSNKDCPLVLASIMLCNQTRVTLGAFYRQPNHTVTEINELLTNITGCTTNSQSERIIGGNFNLPGILWSDGVVIEDVPRYGLEVNNIFMEVCDVLGVHIL